MTVYPTDDGVTISFADMTDRHAAMRAMQEFIAMMAYELRTPLTSINAQVAAQGWGWGWQ